VAQNEVYAGYALVAPLLHSHGEGGARLPRSVAPLVVRRRRDGRHASIADGAEET
jgi:hypothetical protein